MLYAWISPMCEAGLWFMLCNAIVNFRAVTYLVLLSWIISILQESHREIYVKMGEPSLIANNNISNSSRFSFPASIANLRTGS
jgi:hypothetical protein